ncbi:flavin reductase family protein [Dactylosporangium sp. NPDC051484]|uniref:flavin reductase family protein n=1 Tax=Dactylosporangium sp. NPDC051484 TaxID=3154942 RepID=UPI00344F98B2
MSMSAVLHPTDLRRVFGAFPSGVTAVAALVDGAPVGLAASSFTSVSLDPPLVSVCIARTSSTWPTLRRADRLGVSVLAAHQEHLGRQLSLRGGDRFSGVTWRATQGGEILLDGACAWLDCSIEREIPAGDHDIILLRVHALDADRSVPPLVFHQSAFGRLQRAA